MTNSVGNPCSGLGEAHKCGGVKPLNGSQFVMLLS